MILKVVSILALLYLGFRYITKPFRDLANQHKANADRIKKDRENSNGTKREANTKTEDLGDYIDYEDVTE